MPVMSDIEDRLRRYRPGGPAAELRGQVIEASRTARPSQDGHRQMRLRDWVPAAIAASVVIIFHLLASNVRGDVSSRFASADRAREAMVTDLASELGGDERAREEAERLVEAGEQAARAPADSSAGSDVQAIGHD